MRVLWNSRFGEGIKTAFKNVKTPERGTCFVGRMLAASVVLTLKLKEENDRGWNLNTMTQTWHLTWNDAFGHVRSFTPEVSYTLLNSWMCWCRRKFSCGSRNINAQGIRVRAVCECFWRSQCLSWRGQEDRVGTDVRWVAGFRAKSNYIANAYTKFKIYFCWFLSNFLFHSWKNSQIYINILFDNDFWGEKNKTRV